MPNTAKGDGYDRFPAPASAREPNLRAGNVAPRDMSQRTMTNTGTELAKPGTVV